MTHHNVHRMAMVCALGITLSAAPASASEEGAAPSAHHAAISPDGTRLAYISDVDGSRDLWLADANGSHAAALLPWPDSDENEASWSPDGAFIVFSSTRGAATHHIWRVAADGSNPQALTSNPAASHEYPQYSPQGTTILYLSNATGKRELWLMQNDGSAQHPLALIPSRVSDPAWAPDGTRIVYVGCKRGAECSLFTINSDGSGGRRVTSGDFQDWNPSWGSRGILFASNRGDSQGLWLVRPDGTGLTQVTAPVATADLDPRWIGAGDGFVFSRSGSGAGDAASNIWSSASLTAVSTQLTHVVVDSTPPEVVPVVQGALGAGGWYVGPVNVAWQVSDPESGIAAATGCESVLLADDTAGVTLTCSAVNGAGISARKSIALKIDATPPVISGMPVAPCALWPPNHKLVEVARIAAADALSQLATLQVTGSSSQPATAAQDIVISGGEGEARTVQLRAERGGKEATRVYSIVAVAEDRAGNRTLATASCTVPHDQGN